MKANNMKQSLLLLAGVAVGCAATAVAQRVLASRSAAASDDRSADAKKKAPVTFDSALITLEMPDNPSAVRSNRALINAAVKRVRRCVFLAFEGGAPSATSTDGGKKQRVSCGFNCHDACGARSMLASLHAHGNVCVCDIVRGLQVDTSVLVKALGHYDDVNDAALAAGNLHLDCRVLLPVQGLCTERSLWRLPQLEAIFGVPSDELLAIVHQARRRRWCCLCCTRHARATYTAYVRRWVAGQHACVPPSPSRLVRKPQLNDGRRDAGLGQVTFVSLAKEAALSEFEHHIYFDDICGRLPSFPNVRALRAIPAFVVW